jgi:hypothetical protein
VLGRDLPTTDFSVDTGGEYWRGEKTPSAGTFLHFMNLRSSNMHILNGL